MSKLSCNKPSAAAQVDRARVIVCERTGRWATALTRELSGDTVRVYQTRSLSECWEMLAAYRAGFLVIEVTQSNLAPLLKRLAEIELGFPAARFAAVGDRKMGSFESVLREAGAIQFTTSLRSVRSIARAAQRHLETVPKPRLSVVEKVWASIPWGR